MKTKWSKVKDHLQRHECFYGMLAGGTGAFVAVILIAKASDPRYPFSVSTPLTFDELFNATQQAAIFDSIAKGAVSEAVMERAIERLKTKTDV